MTNWPTTGLSPGFDSRAQRRLTADEAESRLRLCWLLVASVGELDVSIASLLLFFDIQYAKWSEDFPC